MAINHPLAWVARRLLGDTADVVLIAPSGVDPGHWTPDDEAMGRLQAADLVLLDGPGTAGWLPTAPLSRSRVVDTTAGLGDLLIEVTGPTHAHGVQGEHSHMGEAVTTWLDPVLFVEQVRVGAHAFGVLMPDRRSQIDAEAERIARGLADVDERIRAAVSLDPGRPVLASHPVYQYVEARYGMNLESVHWEPGEPPGDAGWSELDAILSEHPAQAMFWEGTPAPETVAGLTERGVRSLVFDPGANPPAPTDMLALLEAGAQAVEQAYRD